MASVRRSVVLDALKSGIGVPFGVLAVLAMVILPLPPLALDVLFTFNIALSLVVVMAVVYAVARPLDFGVFPTRAAAGHLAAPGAQRRVDTRGAAARPRRARPRRAR